MAASDWKGLNGIARRLAFADKVARGTGLDRGVVEAWVLLEAGPVDNPLNIERGQHFGSLANAASATVKLLHGPRYQGVLRSAGRPINNQFTAIATSPWVGRDDPMHGRRYLAALKGVYKTRVTKPYTTEVQDVAKTTGEAALAVGLGVAARRAKGLTRTGFGVGAGAAGLYAIGGEAKEGVEKAISSLEHFVVDKSVLALAYVVLTGAALALFVLGTVKLAGGNPGSTLRSASRGDWIPKPYERIPF